MRRGHGALALGLALLVAAGTVVASAVAARAGAPTIRVASTTSTEASGLFAHILPVFTRATGIGVHVVAVGTGQALRIAARGDADVLLVHHRPSEQRFVREGYGVARHVVMYNDFVIVGPRADPAGILGLGDAPAALARIAAARALFISRDDTSGTHKRELSLWAAVGIAPDHGAHRWYRAIGAGMGRTLNTAAATAGYTLTDRGTWLSFNNKRDLVALVEGDTRLYNPYGVILVDPKRHRHIKAALGQKFIDWLLSDEGQAAIASLRVGGERLFHPSARRAHGK